MDTISNLANTASKLIYGDPQQQSGQEPVSGQAGAGTATDPYDSGNLHDDPEKAGKPAQQTNPNATLNATTDDASAEPCLDGANLVDRTKHTSGADKTFDAERGSSTAATTEGSARGVNITGDLHPEHATTQASPGPDESQEKGTGEKHIKSTGFSADGGDFDASKPGAGREADRLLESKGVHRDAGPIQTDSESPSPSPARSQDNLEHSKTSMKTKIKEKLHIGKH
ncbi:hypothetical protein BKA81DRAFT_407495 [Phyllosticta paracitricarpa]|uniref:Uncharacterized protein n=1 Tax=Phyllosticta paracitricarpa TaxID=2016321 RepID=A0ABR1N1F1_9PEZI